MISPAFTLRAQGSSPFIATARSPTLSSRLELSVRRLDLVLADAVDGRLPEGAAMRISDRRTRALFDRNTVASGADLHKAARRLNEHIQTKRRLGNEQQSGAQKPEVESWHTIGTQTQKKPPAGEAANNS